MFCKSVVTIINESDWNQASRSVYCKFVVTSINESDWNRASRDICRIGTERQEAHFVSM